MWSVKQQLFNGFVWSEGRAGERAESAINELSANNQIMISLKLCAHSDFSLKQLSVWERRDGLELRNI